MVDELLDLQTCRVCGTALVGDERQAGNVCVNCAAANHDHPDSFMRGTVARSEAEPPLSDRCATEEVGSDPDHPTWSLLAGLGVWIASVAAIIIVPVLAVILWYIISKLRGVPVPSLQAQDELFEWLKSPRSLLVQIAATFVAHLVTLAICWPVVTKLGTRRFWSSLGWHWAGRSPFFWLLFSAVVIAALLGFTQVAARILPQSEENSFAELLRSSGQVRIAVALLATFSAPIVEEVIYRGMLFSALRKRAGLVASVLFVTMLFAGVHVVQYAGAWVTISGLVLLSLILTLVRARTGSILPCVAIHFANNAFFSVIIVANKG